jgi:hypothetical protein
MRVCISKFSAITLEAAVLQFCQCTKIHIQVYLLWYVCNTTLSAMFVKRRTVIVILKSHTVIGMSEAEFNILTWKKVKEKKPYLIMA